MCNDSNIGGRSGIEMIANVPQGLGRLTSRVVNVINRFVWIGRNRRGA
jgi:hypothetical protein